MPPSRTLSFALTEPADAPALQAGVKVALSFALTEPADTPAVNVTAAVADATLSFALTEPADTPAMRTGDGTGARHFNGTSSDYLSHDDNASLRSPSTAITIAAWVRMPAAQAAYAAAVYKQGGASWWSWALDSELWPYKSLKAFVGPSTSGLISTASTADLTLNTWYFSALRWADGEKLNLDVYNADGSLFGHVESAGTGTGSIAYGAYPVLVGKDPLNAAYWNGDISQLYIDDSKLSDADVQTLLKGTPPATASAGWWPLQGTESPEPDAAQGNDLTVYGTTNANGPPRFTSFALTEPADTPAFAATVTGSAATLSFALTEPADTLEAVLAVVVDLSFGITEPADLPALNAAVLIEASFALTEPADQLTAAIDLVLALTFGITEPADTPAFAADVSAATRELAFALTEPADTPALMLATPSAGGRTRLSRVSRVVLLTLASRRRRPPGGAR